VAHLAVPRRGWECENLAEFILRKFSFIARPATVADDVGSDFFCVLFETHPAGSSEQLVARNSFAIQVKSNLEPLNVSNKLIYLENLEIPFFLGVVDRKALRLSFYSGEYMPAFFSHKGIPVRERVKVRPCERSEVDENDPYPESRGTYSLMFPRVTEIAAAMEGEELRARVQAVHKTCGHVGANMASRRQEEHLFWDQNRARGTVYSGQGSVAVYRRNLCARLAVAFANLEWIYDNCRDRFDMEEFKAYERFLGDLDRQEIDGAGLAQGYYKRIKGKLPGSGYKGPSRGSGPRKGRRG
jgi:hypothetical protein